MSAPPQSLVDFARHDAARVARNQAADREIEAEAAEWRRWTEKTLETGTPDERHALLDDFVARSKAYIFPPRGDDDWEDVSVAERAAVRRAVDKFRSLTEPARKSAAGARSNPATRPATISSTGPAADGDSIPPSVAVSPRGAR